MPDLQNQNLIAQLGWTSQDSSTCTILEVFTDAAISARQFKKLYQQYRSL
jgi:hypothetical protein